MDKQQLTQHLEDVLEEGYNFNIGEYIKEGWEIYKSLFAEYLMFTVAFMLIMIVTGFIPFASIFLSAPLTAGFYLVAHRLTTNNFEDFSNFFDGFKFFGPLVLQTLIISLISLAIILPFALSMGLKHYMDLAVLEEMNPEDFTEIFGMMKSMFLLIIPIFFIAISLIFAPFFVLFFKQDFWSGIVFSFKFVLKNWIMVFLFAIVLGLISMAGVFVLFIGLLFVIPLTQTSLYAAFADITRLYDIEKPEDDFGIEDI